MARGAPHGPRRRAAVEQHDHVRPRRRPAALGAPPARGAVAPACDGRLHRVRAAPLRAHGGAALPQGAGAQGADVRRAAADARGRSPRTPPAGRERAGLVGEGGAAGRRRGAARRGERPRGDADERVDLARGRGGVGAGASAGADGGVDPIGRADPAPADDALRRPADGAGRALVRRASARGAVEPARERGTPLATCAPAPAGAAMRRIVGAVLAALVVVPLALASTDDGSVRRPHVPLAWEQHRAVARLAAAGEPVFCGGGRSNAVALTFDDGPGDYADRIVRILRANDAHATFFVVGYRVRERPAQLRELATVGVIGNHSWSHAHLPQLAQLFAWLDLVQLQHDARAALGSKPTLFRAPYEERTGELDRLVRR